MHNHYYCYYLVIFSGLRIVFCVVRSNTNGDVVTRTHKQTVIAQTQMLQENNHHQHQHKVKRVCCLSFTVCQNKQMSKDAATAIAHLCSDAIVASTDFRFLSAFSFVFGLILIFNSFLFLS